MYLLNWQHQAWPLEIYKPQISTLYSLVLPTNTKTHDLRLKYPPTIDGFRKVDLCSLAALPSARKSLSFAPVQDIRRKGMKRDKEKEEEKKGQ